jgi:hypothetical protein
VVMCGAVRPGRAGRGLVWVSRRGRVRYDKVWCGLARVSWRSTARFGRAGPGLVGVSRFGEVRFG